MMTLANVADEIQHRLIHIFARDNEVRIEFLDINLAGLLRLVFSLSRDGERTTVVASASIEIPTTGILSTSSESLSIWTYGVACAIRLTFFIWEPSEFFYADTGKGHGASPKTGW
jgi:hypothetical protein